MGGFAWVTLATNDSYSLGALVLAHSLRRVGTKHELVVMVTPGVTEVMREKLSGVFNLVHEVNVLDSKDEANLALLARPELGITFTKLHCWRLTQYDKCVFIDADALVIRNCDELFEREELSAAPDVGWPDCFNSGVFVYKPSQQTFASITAFAAAKGSFDGGDQGLLNMYFSDWAHKDISKHLPFIYNMCSTATYSYLPAFKQFGEDVRIIHFIGITKPWLQYFDTLSGVVQPPPGSGHLQPLLQIWWNIFCDNVHPQLSPVMASSTLAPIWHKFTLQLPAPPHSYQPHQTRTLPSYPVYHEPIHKTYLDYSSPSSPKELDFSEFKDPWENYQHNNDYLDMRQSAQSQQYYPDCAECRHEYVQQQKEQQQWKNDSENLHKPDNQYQHEAREEVFQEHHWQGQQLGIPDYNKNHEVNYTISPKGNNEVHQEHNYSEHQPQHHSYSNYVEGDINHWDAKRYEDQQSHNYQESQSHRVQEEHHPGNHEKQHHQEPIQHHNFNVPQYHHVEHYQQPHQRQDFQSHDHHHHHRDQEHHHHYHHQEHHHHHRDQEHHNHYHHQEHHHHHRDQEHHNHSHHQEHHHHPDQEHHKHHYQQEHHNHCSKHQVHQHHHEQQAHQHDQDHTTNHTKKNHSHYQESHHDHNHHSNEHHTSTHSSKTCQENYWHNEHKGYDKDLQTDPLIHSDSHESNLPCTDPNTLATQSDTSIGNQLESEDAGLAGALAKLTLGEARSLEQVALEEHMRKQSWEQGQIDYMGRDSFENIWKKICETLSTVTGAETSPEKDSSTPEEPEKSKEVVSAPTVASKAETPVEHSPAVATEVLVEEKVVEKVAAETAPTESKIQEPSVIEGIDETSTQSIKEEVPIETPQATQEVPSGETSLPSQQVIVSSEMEKIFEPSPVTAPSANVSKEPSSVQLARSSSMTVAIKPQSALVAVPKPPKTPTEPEDQLAPPSPVIALPDRPILIPQEPGTGTVEQAGPTVTQTDSTVVPERESAPAPVPEQQESAPVAVPEQEKAAPTPVPEQEKAPAAIPEQGSTPAAVPEKETAPAVVSETVPVAPSEQITVPDQVLEATVPEKVLPPIELATEAVPEITQEAGRSVELATEAVPEADGDKAVELAADVLSESAPVQSEIPPQEAAAPVESQHFETPAAVSEFATNNSVPIQVAESVLHADLKESVSEEANPVTEEAISSIVAPVQESATAVSETLAEPKDETRTSNANGQVSVDKNGLDTVVPVAQESSETVKADTSVKAEEPETPIAPQEAVSEIVQKPAVEEEAVKQSKVEQAKETESKHSKEPEIEPEEASTSEEPSAEEPLTPTSESPKSQSTTPPPESPTVECPVRPARTKDSKVPGTPTVTEATPPTSPPIGASESLETPPPTKVTKKVIKKVKKSTEEPVEGDAPEGSSKKVVKKVVKKVIKKPKEGTEEASESSSGAEKPKKVVKIVKKVTKPTDTLEVDKTVPETPPAAGSSEAPVPPRRKIKTITTTKTTTTTTRKPDTEP